MWLLRHWNKKDIKLRDDPTFLYILGIRKMLTKGVWLKEEDVMDKALRWGLLISGTISIILGYILFNIMF